MPSLSISRVSVMRANSISRATSALLRASREISIPNIAPADLAHQLAEAFPRDTEAARDAQVGVDDLDIRARPAEPDRFVGQAVLPHRGLGMLADLRHRRLAQVDHRQPFPVKAGDLLLAVHHSLPALPPSCWPAPLLPPPGQGRPGRHRSPSTPALAGPAARR